MKPSELGSQFKRSVEAKDGDPTAPTVPLGVDAFLEGLSESVEEREEDVLLFEVFREENLDDPNEGGDVVAVLDRRLFYGDPPKTAVLIIRWTFDDDSALAKHECQIMGRGPGLIPDEGMMSTGDFVHDLQAAPALERMAQLQPKRVRVWAEQRDGY